MWIPAIKALPEFSLRGFMPKIKVGIIGCGTIGSALAKLIERRFSRAAVLSYLCEQNFSKASTLRRKLKSKPAILNCRELIRKSDLVIEAASARISGLIAQSALRAGKNILILSVGGLLSPRQPERSEGSPSTLLRMTGNGRLWIPSGAIAGVDALLAAKEAGLQSVKLVTRKPPAGLSEAPYFQKKKFPKLESTKEYCVFKGNAAEAVRNFPQNINVAALLSLAGLGPKKTRVEIWTSNAYRANQHEVTILSKAGEIRTVTKNLPFPENPKTSALAAYSAAALLRKIFSSIRAGT